MPNHRHRSGIGLYSLIVAFWLGTIPVTGASAPQAHGLLIDVGGHLLHIQCRGEGLPVVVLDAGLGGASSDWRKVQPDLATTNRTCIYDRAGYGRSDAGPLPRTSARIAAELRTLLMLAELPPPYLLVGHSFGGYNMRLFAGLFPGDTAGVVLVDSPHEKQAKALFEQGMLGFLDPRAGCARSGPRICYRRYPPRHPPSPRCSACRQKPGTRSSARPPHSISAGRSCKRHPCQGTFHWACSCMAAGFFHQARSVTS